MTRRVIIWATAVIVTLLVLLVLAYAFFGDSIREQIGGMAQELAGQSGTKNTGTESTGPRLDQWNSNQ